MTKKTWDSFALISGTTLIEVNGDGFQLENKMNQLKGKFPMREYAIIQVEIKEK